MGMFSKQGSPFLYDEDTKDIVGISDPDGSYTPILAPLEVLGLRSSGLSVVPFLPSNGDIGAALQLAHDALPSTGGRILIPAGQFTALTPCIFSKNVEVIGCGVKLTKISTALTSVPIITAQAGISIKDLYAYFSGTANTQNGNSFVAATGNAWGNYFSRVAVGMFDVGIDVQQAWAVRAEFCRFWDCKTYGMSISNTELPDEGDHDIIGCEFANSQYPNSVAALHWQSSGGLKVTGGKFLGHQNSIQAVVGDGVATSIIQVTGVSIEGMSNSGINISRPDGGTTGTLGSVTITGCQFGARWSGGGTSKIIRLGAGISDAVITGNLFNGASGNHFGVYVEDGYLGGGSVSGNHFLDVGTAIHFPASGAQMTIGRNSYKGTCKTCFEGCSSSGASRRGFDSISTDLTAWNPNQNGTTYWLYKVFIPANRTCEIDVSFGGIQNGAGGHHRYRKFVAYNNGGAITLTDLIASTQVGVTTATWSENVGVVGTSNLNDGVVIGVRPPLSQLLDGDLSIKLAGYFNKIRRLDMYSITASGYSWNASQTTGEYFLTSASGGDPAMQHPGVVSYNAGTSASPNYVPLSRGTLGSLGSGAWGYGDNDSLGYSTLYVKLSDASNPSSKNADYLNCAA